MRGSCQAVLSSLFTAGFVLQGGGLRSAAGMCTSVIGFVQICLNVQDTCTHMHTLWHYMCKGRKMAVVHFALSDK